MRSKRGSHIGLVLSFIIFMGFLFFLYLIINPSLTVQREETSLRIIASEIAQKTSANLTKISVRIAGNGEGCVRLSGFLIGAGSEDKFNVRFQNGSQTDFYKYSSDLIIFPEDEILFKFYESPEFSTAPIAESEIVTGCTSMTLNSNYFIGYTKKDVEIFESKISEIISDYAADYDNTKSYIGIPESKEFGFSLKKSQGSTITTKDVQRPDEENIFSEEFPVIFVREDGGVNSGILEVRVWG